MIETKHIVVVDDDEKIANLLHEFLTKNHYQVTKFNDAESFLNFSLNNVDLLILDLMLPKMSGMELCRHLRIKSFNLPIIMLTAVTEDIEKIIGLEMGADDYLTKPFNPRELLARIRSIFRRLQQAHESSVEEVVQPVVGKIFKFAGWILNVANRQLFSSENIEISLSSRSYDLLIAFLERPQQVLSRDHLLNILANRSAEPFDRSIDVQVSRLRMKLQDDIKDPKLIKTIRNGGYILTTTVKKC